MVGLLAYLPLQDLAITYAPGQGALVARFAPDALVAAAALASIARWPAVAFERCRKIVAPVAIFLLLWIEIGRLTGVSTSTLLAGARSEFRFFPLVVVAACSASPRKDARAYVRILAALATAEAIIAIAEAAGGEAVRQIFAPHYSLAIGQTVIGRADPLLTTITGTFTHRVILGTFLALVGILVAAAGAQQLGLSRRVAIGLWSLLAVGTILTGAREAVIALALGTGIALSREHGMPTKRMLAGSVALATLIALAVVPQHQNSDFYSPSLRTRWTSLASAAAWRPASDGNFRLYFAVGSVKAVAHHAPVAGFGLGTVSDPRAVVRPASPLNRYREGRDALRTRYYTDSNWVALLLETGYAGLALLGILLIILYRMGSRCGRSFWGGSALAATVAAVGLFGLVAPALQLRPTSFILWLFVGLVIAQTSGAEDAKAKHLHPS